MKIISFGLFSASIIVAYSLALNASLLESKMLNGYPVPEETMKGLVAFRGNQVRLCSGILITPNQVLTSAYCLFSMHKFANNPICRETGAYIEETKFDVERTWKHGDYDFTSRSRSYNFDLGLADLKIEFDLNTNALSILHSNYMHMAGDFILHGQMATIYSWGFISIDTNQTPSEHTLRYLHGKRKMDIVIEESELCDIITKKEKFEKSGQYNQMCGRPLVEGQQIILQNTGSPVIYEDKIIGVATYREKFAHGLTTCVIMRVHNIKNFFPSIPSTSIV